MAEDNDYSPGTWEGYDYTSAASAYVAPTAGRGYGTASAAEARVAYGETVPLTISTACKRPLIIGLDRTGSYGDWREVVGKKVMYMDKEVPTYLGEDVEFCIAGIGDASDDEPLQVRPFSKGLDLVKQVTVLKDEDGFGNEAEAYSLLGLYLLRNASFAPDAKPVLIYVCDEGFHDRVEARQAAWAHIDTKGLAVSTSDIMAELVKKFSVYVIRKPYPRAERSVHRQWTQFLGEDRVFMLEDPKRVLDMIFGCLGLEMDMMDYFHKEMTGRQTPEQCKTVFTALRTNHVGSADGKSTMLLPGSAAAKLTRHLA